MMNDDTPSLPEYRDNPFINRLPSILSLQGAITALTNLPTYKQEERDYPAHIRSHCLLRLARCFVPFERHLSLEVRLSALIRQGYVGRNPNTTDYLHRLHNDHARVLQEDLTASIHPVETTASGFALIGCSGIGKTKSIERILSLYPKTIHHRDPFSLEQVVWMKLECPVLCSTRHRLILPHRRPGRYLVALTPNGRGMEHGRAACRQCLAGEEGGDLRGDR